MDVNWTAEFAEAGWIKPWAGADRAAVTNGVLAGPIATATWKGRLYGAPANSNTSCSGTARTSCPRRRRPGRR